MGHKSGGRHDGSQGTLAARRLAKKKRDERIVGAVLETSVRKQVRELAAGKTAEAVETLLDVMHDEDEWGSTRISAAKAILKLAEADAPAPQPGAGAEDGGGPQIVIQLLSVTGELAKTVTVNGLPAQEQRTRAPRPSVLTAEVP